MGAAETVAAADVPTVGAMLAVEIESGDLETVAADARTARCDVDWYCIDWG